MTERWANLAGISHWNASCYRLQVTIAAPGGWGLPPGASGAVGSGEEDGLVRAGHHVHEFAFDGVLVFEREPALPAGGIQSRLAEPLFLNGPLDVPRIDIDLVLSAWMPRFLFLIDEVEEPRGWLEFYVPEDFQEFNP